MAAPIASARPSPITYHSWDSLDDRIRPGVRRNSIIDTFRRVSGNSSNTRISPTNTDNLELGTIPTIEPILPAAPATHILGWRTILQIFGVMVACSTLSIACFNLYSRTHPQSDSGHR